MARIIPPALVSSLMCLGLLGFHPPVMAQAPAPPSAPTNAIPARPKIGLALGGGGALGLAHVGVLKELEALRIPIDYIGGTSMGAIVAGLYAAGLSPSQIEDFMLSLDWWDVLTDRTPRQELDFRRKKEAQRYLFDFEMGVGRRGVKLPPGLAAGQKFNNLLQALMLGTYNAPDFDRLPIPYRAVATDLRTGEMVILSKGNLATAVRASMAVPGVFTPVEIDGRLLIDGGIVNNLPVDIVREMGADIIIAVDVGAFSTWDTSRRLESMTDILNQTYQLMSRLKDQKRLNDADILITPPLKGYSASAFEKAPEIMPLGGLATRAVAEKLTRLQSDYTHFNEYLQRQRRPTPARVPIATISIDGNRRVKDRVVKGRIRSQPGKPFDANTVELDLLRMYGIGDFEQVVFQIRPGENERHDLHYQLKEKSWGPNYLHFGMKFNSDFRKDIDWGLLINLTKMDIGPLGAEWWNDLQLGSEQKVYSEFYQPLDVANYFFVAPSFLYDSRTQHVYHDQDRIAEYDITTVRLLLSFGIQLKQYMELRMGPYWSKNKSSISTGSADLMGMNDYNSGFMGRLVIDRLDRLCFARDGFYMEVAGTWAWEGMGGDRTYEKVSAIYQQYLTLKAHTLHWGLVGGTSLGSDLPSYDDFLLGGPFVFSGLVEDQFRGNYLGVATLGYRYRLARLPPTIGQEIYAVARVDAGNVWNTSDEITEKDLRYGIGVGVGASTALGPAYLGFGQTTDGFNCFYVSLGTVF